MCLSMTAKKASSTKRNMGLILRKHKNYGRDQFLNLRQKVNLKIVLLPLAQLKTIYALVFLLLEMEK